LKLSHIEINDHFYDYHNFPDSLSKKISFNNVDPYSNYPNGLKLSHNQNHLSFHFSAIDWSAPDKIKYSYRMVGLDEKWSTPSEETMADYRNLNHGSYQLQIKAIGQSQVWTEPFTYRFIILPAWWQTWWFRALVILAIATLAFFIGRFIYFYQLRKQRIAMEKKLAVQYERQRISAEMHDDIGAGLSGIRLLTEMTKNKVKDEKAAEEVDKIYQSVGDISSKMKEVIWSLNTENDNLSNLVFYIQKQARLWLEHYPCQLVIDMPETIPAIDINGEARRNILLIVKEAVHNIIKHSGANKVNIKMSFNHLFTISITDNGKGINTSLNNGLGNGMKNMQRRVQALQGNMEIKTENGFSLLFEIPLQSSI
jgi:two-component sensor histidine kinase